MPKITSIDALIDRVKVAYPRRHQLPDRILELMGRDSYAAAYSILNNNGSGRYRSAFYSHQILKTVDDDGNVIADKFAELVEEARKDAENQELESVRWQLQHDFKESYVFTWIPD